MNVWVACVNTGEGRSVTVAPVAMWEQDVTYGNTLLPPLLRRRALPMPRGVHPLLLLTAAADPV